MVQYLTAAKLLPGSDLGNAVTLLLNTPVLILLGFVQRMIKHLHLESLLNIGALAKPQNDLITEVDTLIRL